ncbi:MULTISPECIES: peptidoglycan DD-metalloendopeptidase family protein [Vibrio]|uniref:Peptidase M23 n=1 Tax=Vibrio bivalvicida TaxID=1276888 RepID=A0A177XWS3_9VIBR|nr:MULTISPECIES: peptidoglycan DD-metalloendopeptidase family protein [Vibrio]KLN63043.1 peptidase M23 [Vibrio sp. VPAP30]OAJ93031.1 peptidase M23 [Vibrio bivalvicida]
MTSLIFRQNTNNIALTLFVIAVAVVFGVSVTHSVLTPDTQFPTPSNSIDFRPPTKTTSHKLAKKNVVVTGTIDYSFITSMINVGLSKREINSLLKLIGNNFDIVGSVRKGDRFSIKLESNRYNERNIRSFYYSGSGNDFFVSTDNDNGALNEFGAKFNTPLVYRYPLNSFHKVSSEFNLKRKHPITKRITPHLGTDYAVPIGTPIYSVADGRVIKSRYNRFAGHYINIQHADGAISRYLHLSQRNVRAGDKITQGQQIGRSGNSGRTTGPHLHIELVLNGRHVDFEHYTSSTPRSMGDPKKLISAQLDRNELVQALAHTALEP